MQIVFTFWRDRHNKREPAERLSLAYCVMHRCVISSQKERRGLGNAQLFRRLLLFNLPVYVRPIFSATGFGTNARPRVRALVETREIDHECSAFVFAKAVAMQNATSELSKTGLVLAYGRRKGWGRRDFSGAGALGRASAQKNRDRSENRSRLNAHVVIDLAAPSEHASSPMVPPSQECLRLSASPPQDRQATEGAPRSYRSACSEESSAENTFVIGS